MQFSHDEIGLLSDKKTFEIKVSATEKVKELMAVLRQDLLEMMQPSKLLAPNGVDFEYGQIAKGENHEGYPYVVMDFPKFYTKTDMFSFRTFFWFGHGLFFSTILAGTYLPDYLAKLDKYYSQFSEKQFLFGNEKLWDWQPASIAELRDENKPEVLERAKNQAFLKLMRFFDPEILTQEELLRKEWRAFYQTVERIISK